MLIPRRQRPWLSRLALLLLSATPLPASATQSRGRLCNSTISSANGTGTASFSVDDFLTAQLANGTYNATAGRPLPDPSWLVTLADDVSEPMTEFWLDTAGQTYWDDVQTQFDACAFIIRGQVPFATMEAAQTDDGDCRSMLSLACRQALLDQVSLAASQKTSMARCVIDEDLRTDVLTNRLDSSSITSNSSELVSDICADIAQALAWDPSKHRFFPQACSQDFGYDMNWSGPTNTHLALTGRHANETSLNPQCPISAPIGKKYYNVAGFSYPSTYDTAARIVTPILTVFFASPNANPAAQFYRAPTQISCLRVTSFTSGSQTAPPLYSASASAFPGSSFAGRTSKGLSLAAVLALSLSCCALVGFLIGFSAFHKWWRSNWRRIEIVDQRIQTDYRIERRAKHAADNVAAKDIELEEREPEEMDGTQIVEAPVAPGPFELDGADRRPSFNSSRRSLGSLDSCESITATAAPGRQ